MLSERLSCPARDAEGPVAARNAATSPPLVMAFPSARPVDILPTLEAAVDQWQHARPDRKATRDEVATHESGHIVAAESLGFGPAEAEVHMTWEGWVGSTRLIINPNLASLGLPYTNQDLRAAAIVYLSGPAGEVLYQGIDFLRADEIVSVTSHAVRIAEMEGLSFAATLADLTRYTARLLHLHRTLGLKLAGRLSRQKHLSRSERPVARMLDSVRAVSLHALPPAPEQEEELTRRLAGVPIDLHALAREIIRVARGGVR